MSRNKRPESFILTSVVRVVFFFVTLLTLYLFLKGHNAPGGGFIAGVAASIALVMLNMTMGIAAVRRVIKGDPMTLAIIGVVLAYLTALAPIMLGRPFLFHKMLHLHLPILGDQHVGTPMLFDLGVFLVVVGVTAKIAILFSEKMDNDDHVDDWSNRSDKVGTT